MLYAFTSSHSFVSIQTELEALDHEYALMKDYMLRGFDDPMRANLYQGLLKKAYRLNNNAMVDVWREKDSLFSSQTERFGEGRFQLEAIKSTLEQFVQDSTLLSLEPQETRKAQAYTLYDRHYNYVSELFNVLVTSYQWSESQASFMQELLLSPTIESVDAQLLLSAITLSAMQFFDIRKFQMLLHLAKYADDEHIRQRALVGVAFSLPTDEERLFDELPAMMRSFVNKERVRELAELQMQVFYCKNADQDMNEIQRDIMPNLAGSSTLKISKTGIIELDENKMQDLLGTGSDDRNMEKIESSMQRMIDMQRAGSDIYFGGFAQMKRFSFFYRLSNWFCPFSFSHPDVLNLPDRLLQSKFLNRLMKQGPFCDSDKYSFVLSMAQVFNRLPDNMKEAFESGAAMGEMMVVEDTESPTYIRRVYLQNLYRFFRLSPSKDSFYNPFLYEGSGRQSFFFVNPLLSNTNLKEKATALARFLWKKKNDLDLKMVIRHYQSVDNLELLKIAGVYFLHLRDFTKAVAYFFRVLLADPNDEQALQGYAQASFCNGDYKEAEEQYALLQKAYPENKKYVLNHAVAQINLGETEAGMAQLFKLSYQNDNDYNVKRAMAWGYLLQNKPDEAEQLYRKILVSPNTLPSDDLNMAYALWFQGKMSAAVELLKSYLAKARLKNEDTTHPLVDAFAEDNKLLEQYHISLPDRMIMIDLANE